MASEEGMAAILEAARPIAEKMKDYPELELDMSPLFRIDKSISHRDESADLATFIQEYTKLHGETSLVFALDCYFEWKALLQFKHKIQQLKAAKSFELIAELVHELVHLTQTVRGLQEEDYEILARTMAGILKEHVSNEYREQAVSYGYWLLFWALIKLPQELQTLIVNSIGDLIQYGTDYSSMIQNARLLGECKVFLKHIPHLLDDYFRQKLIALIKLAAKDEFFRPNREKQGHGLSSVAISYMIWAAAVILRSYNFVEEIKKTIVYNQYIFPYSAKRVEETIKDNPELDSPELQKIISLLRAKE